MVCRWYSSQLIVFTLERLESKAQPRVLWNVRHTMSS